MGQITERVAAGGPVYAEDGRLVLDESFLGGAGTPAPAGADPGELVEVWRIWDCEGRAWAPAGLTLFRYDGFDEVVREGPGGGCRWRGAVDTRERVLASRDPEAARERCWQWLRVAERAPHSPKVPISKTGTEGPPPSPRTPAPRFSTRAATSRSGILREGASSPSRENHPAGSTRAPEPGHEKTRPSVMETKNSAHHRSSDDAS